MTRNQASQQLARQRTIKARGSICQQCGASGYVELHHTVEVINGGTHDDSNLVLLCYECHQKEHGNTLGKKGKAFAEFVRHNHGMA
jgi:5-methylcytosine-specific restriction endonuclease McrA